MRDHNYLWDVKAASGVFNPEISNFLNIISASTKVSAVEHS